MLTKKGLKCISKYKGLNWNLIQTYETKSILKYSPYLENYNFLKLVVIFSCKSNYL